MWLVGILLLGVAAMLGAVTLLATVVAYRARGMTLMRLPFFVWSQVVSALLLLLAFPRCRRGRLPVDGPRGGHQLFPPDGARRGQHAPGRVGRRQSAALATLLLVPRASRVYVLVLPAMGIVAEVITAHARRPLWRYGLMVGAVVVLGAWSMVVWAHHMLLTGMTRR